LPGAFGFLGLRAPSPAPGRGSLEATVYLPSARLTSTLAGEGARGASQSGQRDAGIKGISRCHKSLLDSPVWSGV